MDMTRKGGERLEAEKAAMTLSDANLYAPVVDGVLLAASAAGVASVGGSPRLASVDDNGHASSSRPNMNRDRCVPTRPPPPHVLATDAALDRGEMHSQMSPGASGNVFKALLPATSTTQAYGQVHHVKTLLNEHELAARQAADARATNGLAQAQQHSQTANSNNVRNVSSTQNNSEYGDDFEDATDDASDTGSQRQHQPQKPLNQTHLPPNVFCEQQGGGGLSVTAESHFLRSGAGNGHYATSRVPSDARHLLARLQDLQSVPHDKNWMQQQLVLANGSAVRSARTDSRRHDPARPGSASGVVAANNFVMPPQQQVYGASSAQRPKARRATSASGIRPRAPFKAGSRMKQTHAGNYLPNTYGSAVGLYDSRLSQRAQQEAEQRQLEQEAVDQADAAAQASFKKFRRQQAAVNDARAERDAWRSEAQFALSECEQLKRILKAKLLSNSGSPSESTHQQSDLFAPAADDATNAARLQTLDALFDTAARQAELELCGSAGLMQNGALLHQQAGGSTSSRSPVLPEANGGKPQEQKALTHSHFRVLHSSFTEQLADRERLLAASTAEEVKLRSELQSIKREFGTLKARWDSMSSTKDACTAEQLEQIRLLNPQLYAAMGLPQKTSTNKNASAAAPLSPSTQGAASPGGGKTCRQSREAETTAREEQGIEG